jgi:DNA-binding NarL/FixJ family response regulator
MPPKIRVLIADDHRLFAEALEAILSTDERLEIVGKAANGEEAVGLAVALKPDVILMDIAMPKLDGVEAVRLIRTKQPATVILMLTGSNSHSDIDRSRVSGAAGYVTKDLIASQLIAAIIEAAA